MPMINGMKMVRIFVKTSLLTVLVLFVSITAILPSLAGEEPNTVISLSKSKDGLTTVDILKGTIRTDRGMTFKAISPDQPGQIQVRDNIESVIEFKEGMEVQIGKGGFKLKGVFYPENTKLTVGKGGNFIRK